MSKTLRRVLFIPDTHCPFEDKRAWRLVMKVGRAFKPDTLVHMGDLGDCYSISSHSKDPDRVSRWTDERKAVRKLRAEMDALGAKRKVFIEGNHEDRLRRYLEAKAPELAGCVSMDEQLQLTENGWEFYPYKTTAKVGKVNLIHDVGLGGKYSTARALETFQHSVAIGHHHALQVFVGGNATGEHQIGFQLGWLGDFDAVDYLHKVKTLRNWSHGFGVGYHDLKTDAVHIQAVPLVDYACVVDGRLFRG